MAANLNVSIDTDIHARFKRVLATRGVGVRQAIDACVRAIADGRLTIHLANVTCAACAARASTSEPPAAIGPDHGEELEARRS